MNPPGSGWGSPPGGGSPPQGFGPPGGGSPPQGFGPPGGGYPPQGFGPPGGGYPYGPPGGFPPQGYAPPPPPPRRSNVPVVIGALVGVVMLLCVAGIVVGFFLDRDEQRTFGAVAAACEGRAAAGARGYVAGPNGHRVVGATRRGDHWSANNLKVPERLRATGVSDADVVACFGDETQTVVGTCQVYRTRVGIRVPGSDRTFERRQRSVAVRLVSATTGQTITQGAVPGAAPRTCDQPIGRSAMDGDFVGAAPDDDAIGRWIDAALAAPAGGPAMVPLN